MAHALFHASWRHRGSDEHPVWAVIAIIAILAAVLLIAWARIEVHGVADLEATLVSPVLGEPASAAQAPARVESPYEHEREAAVVSNRWAGGLHQ